MSSFSRLFAAAALVTIAAPTAAHAADPFELLGAAGDYTLVALADPGSGTAAGFLQLGSAAHVYGHVGGRNRVETAAGVIVEGDAHYGDGGSLHGGAVWGSDALLDTASWEDLYADAAAAVEAAQALEADRISGTPTAQCTSAGAAADSMGSLVLSAARGEGGLSVYEIDGCLFLGPDETLLIEGTAEDRFVIRVTGGMRLERGAAILLDGVPGSAVLFSLEGGGWAGEPWAQITAEDGPAGDGAELSGVFLSPDMYWQLGDGTLMPDTRILAGGVQANIQDMYPTDTITGSPLEEDEEDDSEDVPGCSSDEEADDLCPWCVNRSPEELDPTPDELGASEDIVAITRADAGSGKGCSAAALGASWLWLVGAGLAAVRRRRQS